MGWQGVLRGWTFEMEFIIISKKYEKQYRIKDAQNDVIKMEVVKMLILSLEI